MAERRMFAKTIVDSDAFLEMPMSARLLYYDLAMRADDDGFINSPKKIMKFIGATNDDMNILILRKFIIPFDNGVVVIKHWRIHNYIRKDTYNETPYKEQKAMLELDENKAYRLSSRLTVDETSTQVRLGKDSIGNISPLPPYEGGVPVEEKSPKKISAEELIAEHNLSEPLSQATYEWLSYKKERRFTYKEQGLKTLIKTISDKSKKYGEDRVIDLIAESISSGYQGILWQRLDRRQQKKDKFNDFEQRNTSKQEMDELERKMLGL